MFKDPKCKTLIVRDAHYYRHLTLQALIAMLFMYLVLFSLNTIAASTIIWAAGASTLASSCYSIFGTPHTRVANPIRIIGGYVIGAVSGELMRYLLSLACSWFLLCDASISTTHLEIAAVISVGLALILMVLLKLEHPPAAGLAVVLVLDIRAWFAVLIILVAAMLLTIIRWVLDKWLINLA